MSNKELNNIELRKVLLAKHLYKPGMNIDDMKHVYNNFILKRDQEFKEGLHERSIPFGENDSNVLTEENNGTILDKHHRVSEESSELNTLPSISEITETNFEKGIENKANCSKKTINVFMSTANYDYKPLKLRSLTRKPSVNFYNQNKIFELPLKERVQAIKIYLLYREKFNIFRLTNLNKWSKPIVPRPNKPFNGDLCFDFESDISDENDEIEQYSKQVTNDGQYKSNENFKSNNSANDDYTYTRSKRQIKRKNYAEFLSDDEDFQSVIARKKSKSIDEFSNVTMNKSSRIKNEESPTDIKWINKKKKNYRTSPLRLSSGSDRTNKIFDKLKQEENTARKNLHENLSEGMDFSDTDDEIFPTSKSVAQVDVIENQTKTSKNKNKTITDSQDITNFSDSDDSLFSPQKSILDSETKKSKNKILKGKNVDVPETNCSDSDEEINSTHKLVTTANVHEDQLKETPQHYTLRKGKNIRKTPTKKRLYNKLKLQKIPLVKENKSPEIATSNFYGNTKNSEVELDFSNNNKADISEKINCPICNVPFPKSKIEEHASNCMEYEEVVAQTLCDICNKIILPEEIQTHRIQCLKKITDASIEVAKPVTRARQQTGKGFLCEVCQQFIYNINETQHASNCIAKV